MGKEQNGIVKIAQRYWQGLFQNPERREKTEKGRNMKKGFVSKDRVCKEIMKREPKIDLLHDIVGCGRFADVTETSDRFFLGMERGDIGYNAFLGKPSEESKRRTKILFNKLPKDVKGDLIFILATKHIKLKDIGIE